MSVNRIILILLSILCGLGDAVAYDKELTDSLRSLDSLLDSAVYFTRRKEVRISALKKGLNESKDLDDRYARSIRLYDEYKAYQYDSAYHYANNSLILADRLDNPEYKLESKCALIFCLLSAGLFKEAFDEFQEIDPRGIGTDYKRTYYSTAVRLNYAIADYNHAHPFCGEYIETGNRLTDSLLNLTDPESVEGCYFLGQKQMKNCDYEASIATFEKMLATDSVDVHTKAILHSCLGWMYWQNGDRDKGLIHLAESAKCDIKASVKETTALNGLAELLYNDGDVDRANEYVQHALSDANFYGARHRKIEVNNILPIIERERYSLLKQQRNLVLFGGGLILVLALALTFALIAVARQKRRVEEAQHQIEERNGRLTRINAQLQEVSKIKNEYIGNSFYQSARFLDKTESVYKTVAVKIAARQYQDIVPFLKNTMLKEERSNMYNVFDNTFLRIFPDFVERYNDLFPESERKYPENNDGLTTEMRIFALIRLGVTSSERIAQFLNKSVHTINTYKTRVKNKSTVDNELFEARIMEIGRVSTP